ncbi:uncharacterized protein LOC120328729 [Styela clava]
MSKSLFFVLMCSCLSISSCGTSTETTKNKRYVDNEASIFICNNGINITQSDVCDGKNNCGNWDDECLLCEEMGTLCDPVPCAVSNQSVRRRQLCDGIFDCHDLSDECLCDRETSENAATHELCHSLLLESQNCSSGYFQCKNRIDGKKSCFPGSMICDGNLDCNTDLDEHYCKRESMVNENNCKKKVYQIADNGVVWMACECDGVVELPDGSDERNCDHYFYCTNDNESFQQLFIAHQDVSKRGNNNVFIDWRRSFDGVADCDNLADEWHEHFFYCKEDSSECQKYGTRYTESADYEVGSRVSLASQWITAIFTVGVNGTVVLVMLRALLWEPGSGAPRSKRIHWIMVLSLCLSDFLIGLQILAVIISDAVMAGQYWKYDIYWKSSHFCPAMGTFVIIGSQANLLTVWMISAIRLYGIVRPFEEIKVRYIILFASLMWTFVIVVSMIPLLVSISTLEKYFTRAVALPTFSQVDATVLDRQNLENLIRKIDILKVRFKGGSAFQPFGIKSMKWRDLESYVVEINPKLGNWKYFGIYSHTSMCYPPILMSANDHGWKYSLGLLVIDCASYTFVVVAYLILWKKSTSEFTGCIQPCSSRTNTSDPIRRLTSGEITGSVARMHEDATMRRRIFLLVATDLATWAPICMLSFVNVIAPDARVKSVQSLAVCVSLVQFNSLINPFLYSKTVRRVAYSLTISPFVHLYKRFVRAKIQRSQSRPFRQGQDLLS